MNRFLAAVSIIFGAIGGAIAYWLGGLDQILIALIALIIIDYITGVLKAIHNSNLNSDVGFKGIIKKVAILLVVAVSFIIEMATGDNFIIREITIMFFIANEGISILENIGEMGVPLPHKLVSILEQLKQEGGANNDENNR